jgi:hypothetical protein
VAQSGVISAVKHLTNAMGNITEEQSQNYLQKCIITNISIVIKAKLFLCLAKKHCVVKGYWRVDE